MSDYRYDRAYRYVEARHVDGLIQKIEEAIQEMASQEDVQHLEILSISHHVVTQQFGSPIYSAFITGIIQVAGGKTMDVPSLREDDLGSSEAPEVGAVLAE